MDLRIFIEPQQGASYEQQLAVAQTAESLGFDAFFRSDHFLVMGDRDGLPGPTDSWVTLGAIARETSTIRLGTLMTSASFRLPGVLAISVAEVDAMSGGRVELGLGAGWFENEHTAYGIPFPSTGERFDRLEEQFEILTGLWTTPIGERYSFDGRQYQLSDSPALPKPVQQPHPPLIVGGVGAKRTPQLAARYAAEFNIPFNTLETTDAAFKRVRELKPDIILSAAQVLCCGSDEAEFLQRAEAIGRQPDELRKYGAGGTVDEVIAYLRRYADLGATRMYLQVLDLDDLDHLALVAKEVAPHL